MTRRSIVDGTRCSPVGTYFSDVFRYGTHWPASRGPRGFEPLCAAYDVGCLPAIEAAIEKGYRAVVSFFPAVDVRIVERRPIAAEEVVEDGVELGVGGYLTVVGMAVLASIGTAGKHTGTTSSP